MFINQEAGLQSPCKIDGMAFFFLSKMNSDSYVGLFLTSFSGERKCLVTSSRTLPWPHNRCLSDCTKGGIWWTADNLWFVVFFISRCESLWLLFVVIIRIQSICGQSAVWKSKKIIFKDNFKTMPLLCVKKYFQKLPGLLRNRRSAFSTLL